MPRKRIVSESPGFRDTLQRIEQGLAAAVPFPIGHSAKHLEMFYGEGDADQRFVTARELKSLMSGGAAKKARKQSHKRRRQKAPDAWKHELVIRRVAAVYQGKDYFLQLTKSGEPPPYKWRQEGCPATYEDLYEDRKWRQRAWRERSNVTQRSK